MVKWYFVNGKVVLCRKECGTLPQKVWYFVGKNVALQRAEQSISAIPLILGMKIFCKADAQRDWRHEGDAPDPPHNPNISPSFLGTIPIINLYVRVKAQK